MVRKHVFVAVGVALPALALAAAAGGANPSGTATDPIRIDIISQATAINNFVDVGPTGLSPGDIYVFVDDVSLPKAPNDPVGEALGRCTVIDPASGRFGCSTTTSLPGGSIITDGTLKNLPGEISTGAITGGTGRFRNARGEAVLDLGPPEGPHRATFRLILQP